MKTILKLALLFICNISFAQTNLLDTSTWTVGSGSVTGFTKLNTDAENIRELGINPHGNSEVLWKAVPDAASDGDGGWNGSYHDIDHTKTYRFSVWIKKTNSNDGSTYFGLYTRDAAGNPTTLLLNGTARDNSYFWSGDLPQLDKWYLLVGFVHDSGYTGTTDVGGIYDGTTGAKVLNIGDDFKFTASATRLMHRSYLYYDTNTADRQFFWGPTIYEVNGQEPTVQDLINGPNSDTQAPTAPTLSSTGQTDTSIDLSWTGATDDTAVTGYKVFKDGALEATLGNVSTYQVTGLTAQTAYSFTVMALDAAGNESVASNAISATTTGSSGSFSLRINAGGPELTHSGEVFLADQYVTGGSTYTNSNALLPVMYQTEHSGTAKEFSYDIPVINGDYTVDLHFAELYWGATGGGTGGTGKRIFDVSVEGTLVMDDYDITADVGSETPVIKTFNATVSDGVLNIDFSSLSAVGGVDQAKVSAIEISGIPVGGTANSPWTQSGSDINYTAGNVGIGTTAPGAYMLAVNGNIHTKEVKVDLVGWADYVFQKDYSLPTLEAVEKYITEKGHLMNIPSAGEVEANGIQLGEMNKLLLEKIEELTLYILEQEERILELEKTNEKN